MPSDNDHSSHYLEDVFRQAITLLVAVSPGDWRSLTISVASASAGEPLHLGAAIRSEATRFRAPCR